MLSSLISALQMQRPGLESRAPWRATDKDRHWQVWESFVVSIPGLDSHLNGLTPGQQLSLLKIFATQAAIR